MPRRPTQTLTRLARLEKAVADLPRIVGAELRKEVRTTIPEIIDRQFDTGTSIYRRRWALPKDGHRPPMIRTGLLRRSFKFRLTKAARGWLLTITNAAPYSSFLQQGTARMEKREHLPRQGRLPAAIRKVLQEAQRRALIRWRKAADRALSS